MECGQILLVDYPFTDHVGSKLRPALVVSADKFNQHEDFVAVPISAKNDLSDPHVFYLDASQAWFGATRLRPESRFVRWSKLMTMTTRVVHRQLGRMPPAQLEVIREQIRKIFG